MPLYTFNQQAGWETADWGLELNGSISSKLIAENLVLGEIYTEVLCISNYSLMFSVRKHWRMTCMRGLTKSCEIKLLVLGLISHNVLAKRSFVVRLTNGCMPLWKVRCTSATRNISNKFLQLLQLQLQKALFDTNIHEHNNNIHVIMLCLETLIKVYTYRLHKSHQGRSDGIRVILSTIACDQRNKTPFCMKWTHSFAQWAAVYKWTYKIYFF